MRTQAPASPSGCVCVGCAGSAGASCRTASLRGGTSTRRSGQHGAPFPPSARPDTARGAARAAAPDGTRRARGAYFLAVAMETSFLAVTRPLRMAFLARGDAFFGPFADLPFACDLPFFDFFTFFATFGIAGFERI